MLFSHMGANDLAEVQVLSPARWGRERGHTVHAPNYHHECLETIGQTITSFRLRGLEDYIIEFTPDVLYAMEEPFSSFTRQCATIAEKHNIPLVVFTWENVLGRSFGERFDKIEAEVIDKATFLIAGNKGAKKRLIHKGAAEDKIAVCPQTGINTQLFADMHLVKMPYDLAYIGRMVKEKGIEYIENVAKDLNLMMLWVGGRGGIKPTYGNYIGWVDYLKMPEYYNKTKLFVTYPFSYQGYSEQMNFSIGEAMACGTPVVSSDNGSIAEVYKAAPIVFAEEANEKSLGTVIEDKFGVRDGSQEAGIQWVHDNLSLDVIARGLLKILKAV
jgi:glycosyltransferase involved in cell wall biosynthesis